MIVWKSLTEYKKPRDETGFHADVALEPGESFSLFLGPDIELHRECPPGKVWKLHVEIAVEEFEEEAND